jgi:hypothetical protein
MGPRHSYLSLTIIPSALKVRNAQAFRRLSPQMESASIATTSPLATTFVDGVVPGLFPMLHSFNVAALGVRHVRVLMLLS